MKTSPVSTHDSRRRFLTQVALATTAYALTPRWSLAADAGPPHKKLGVALVGLGSYSQNKLGPALRDTKYCHLAGVVTGTPAKRSKWIREYNLPERSVYDYTTMSRMADNPDIDVVYVVTPNGLHAEHCIAAARAGKHVICEKPMANTVAECDAIIEACRAAGVRLTVGYRLHYVPVHQELCRLAKEEVFGKFMKLKSANGFRMWDGANPQTSWRVNRKLGGGGSLMDMGVYTIQGICMAKAEASPIAITAKFDPITRPDVFSEVEEGVSWTMEFADGAVAECHSSYSENEGSFRAEAPHGWAQFSEPAFGYETPTLTTSKGRADLPIVHHQTAQLDAMALEFIHGTPSLAPGEMGRRDMAIVEAIFAAAKTGKRVELKS